MTARTPELTASASGRWFAACSGTFVIVGVLGHLPASTALGTMGLLALLVMAQRARDIGQRATKGAVRVQWSHPAGIRVAVNRSTPVSFVLEGPLAGLAAPNSLQPGLGFPARAEAQIQEDGAALILTAPRIGHTWIHGLVVTLPVGHGMWLASAWIPSPLQVSVLPSRFPLQGDGPGSSGAASLMARQAARHSRHHGFGMDLRELRDHQPGDPFKHIAWAATARRRKLTSRVYESDVRRSTWILLDVSPSMFWGEPGTSRIDYGMEAAFQLANLLLDRGERVGLMIHDEHVRLQIAPATGRAQNHRIVRAILEVSSLYHEDRTEVTHRELLDAVGGWFASQEGRHYRLPAALQEVGWVRYGSHDEGRLLAATRARLRSAIGSATPLVPASAYSGDPRRAVFRAFCRHHGIHLPLDPNPRPGAQAIGLERALRSVLASRQGPHNVLLISDLHTADHLDSLRRVAQAARNHRHQLMVMCPSDLDFEALATTTPPKEELEVALDSAQRSRATQSLMTFEAFLRPAGVSVIRCRPDDAIPRVLQQLNRLP